MEHEGAEVINGLCWKERPAGIQEISNEAFCMIANQNFNGYAVLSSVEYWAGSVNTLDFIKACAMESVSILDIGCGKGEFMKVLHSEFPSAKLFGVSAKQVIGDNICYRQFTVNAENICESDVALSTYDIIVSNYALRHFVDPLGTIQQLYELLNINGFLVVDKFICRGLEDYIGKFAEYLSAKYPCSIELCGSTVFGFILQKTSSFPLTMPVSYRILGDNVYKYRSMGSEPSSSTLIYSKNFTPPNGFPVQLIVYRSGELRDTFTPS